jgi:hypothetical protein
MIRKSSYNHYPSDLRSIRPLLPSPWLVAIIPHGHYQIISVDVDNYITICWIVIHKELCLEFLMHFWKQQEGRCRYNSFSMQNTQLMIIHIVRSELSDIVKKILQFFLSLLMALSYSLLPTHLHWRNHVVNPSPADFHSWLITDISTVSDTKAFSTKPSASSHGIAPTPPARWSLHYATHRQPGKYPNQTLNW